MKVEAQVARQNWQASFAVLEDEDTRQCMDCDSPLENTDRHQCRSCFGMEDGHFV